MECIVPPTVQYISAFMKSQDVWPKTPDYLFDKYFVQPSMSENSTPPPWKNVILSIIASQSHYFSITFAVEILSRVSKEIHQFISSFHPFISLTEETVINGNKQSQWSITPYAYTTMKMFNMLPRTPSDRFREHIINRFEDYLIIVRMGSLYGIDPEEDFCGEEM